MAVHNTSENDELLLYSGLDNKTVLITGATGLIGGAIIRALRASGANIRIIAHGRNEEAGAFLSREYRVLFVGGDIREPVLLNNAGDIHYIFHCASITKSAEMISKPVDVITTAVDGTRNILELARMRNSKSVVYLSSMEVYGQTELDMVCETDLGYLDLSSPRSSYPESKRLCESLCVSYYVQYGVPVKIARLALTFGHGTQNNMSDTRVAMQFARKAMSGENIELHTEGKTVTNFCGTEDAARAVLTILVKGENGQAYNVANHEASVTIREMAELVSKQYGVDVIVNVPKDIMKRGYAPDKYYKLNVDKLLSLGWRPRNSLIDCYKAMISDW